MKIKNRYQKVFINLEALQWTWVPRTMTIKLIYLQARSSKIPSLIKTLSRAYRIKAPNWQNISGYPGKKQFVELQKDLESVLRQEVAGEINYYKQSQAAAKTGEGSFDPALSNYGFKVADFDRGLGNSINSLM